MGKYKLIKSCLVYLAFLFLPLIPNGYSETLVSTDDSGGLSIHSWNRYVRHFRRDHNLALSIGYSSSKWNVQKFGEQLNNSYWIDQVSLVAEYSFHILLNGKTGYFLGTSAGYSYSKPEKYENEFQPSPSWLLPGIRAGVSYNYDPTGRFFLGIGAQLERFDALKTHRFNGSWQNMSITGESLQMFAGVDLFFVLETAVHFAWVDTTTYFPRPSNSSDYLVDARLNRRVQGAEIGILYHFL